MFKKSVFFLCCVLPSLLYGQKREKNSFPIQSVRGIQVDGDYMDWHNAFANFGNNLWRFAVAIEGQKLYATAIIQNQELIDEAIRGGIILNISYSNKRKNGAKIIFPKPNVERLEKLFGKPKAATTWTNAQLLESCIGYVVTGFDRIMDGLLSYDNNYGIRAVCKWNDKGELIYEAVVPLDLIKFHTDDVAIELAVNTKYAQYEQLKAAKLPAAPRPLYSRKQPPKQVVTNPFTESVAVWFNGKVK